MAAVLCLGCGSADQTSVGFVPSVERGADEAQVYDEPEGTPDGAVLIGVRVDTPESTNIYVGAQPNVPTGELSIDGMREFGMVDVSVFGGNVFVWDRASARLTRFTVDERLALVEGPSLSFAEYGLVDQVARFAFVSAARAYLLDGSQGLLVEWDPAAMLLVGERDAGLPRYEGLDTSAAFPTSGAGFAAWGVVSQSYASVSYQPEAMLALLRASSSELALLRSTSCAPGSKVYTSGEDLYFIGADASASAYRVYNPAFADRPPPCVLRVRAGSTDFDPDYRVDLQQVTGLPAIWGTWKIDDSHLLVQGWDPEDTFPPLIDDYWGTPSFVTRQVVLDLEGGESVEFAAIGKGGINGLIEFALDGSALYQVSDTDDAGFTVNVLSRDGLEPLFHAFGTELWALQRVR